MLDIHINKYIFQFFLIFHAFCNYILKFKKIKYNASYKFIEDFSNIKVETY
jgi:hypothetical protein